jgi:hypothetical protein
VNGARKTTIGGLFLRGILRKTVLWGSLWEVAMFKRNAK